MLDTRKNCSGLLRKPLASRAMLRISSCSLGKLADTSSSPSCPARGQVLRASRLDSHGRRRCHLLVSPFDLVPDSIPVLGLIDDASLITSVARANLTLISNFRKWETLFDRDLTPSVKY